ncbi:MAG TPA: dihydrolipoamide acetyltransferase family protein [Roseiarcus sp.]|nr:dihydrolipoamide acetyltransferase family protein [Roseiarcus sp.]
MKYVFKLPDLGEGTTKAEIVKWHVATGDIVREDQPLVDMMTDKATMEIPAPVNGAILELHGEPGDVRAVGAELVVFDVASAPHERAAEAAPPPRQAEPAAAARPLEKERPVEKRQAKPIASPVVRRRAAELGVSLSDVPASGPDGRVLREDLEAFAAGRRRPAAARSEDRREGDIEEIKVIGLRRAIAERMQDAKRRIPHITYVEEIDISALEDLREHLNRDLADRRVKLTILPFLIRAMVRGVARYPQCNALFDDEAGIVRRHRAVHVGIATQTASGLMVPVLRHAEALDLFESAEEIARLAERARDGKAARDELVGSTITISSLGPLGGIASTPVINPPEVAIVGVNKIVERPVIQRGQIAVRKMMNLSSSFDHRIIDGWDAASFIQAIKGYLEQPATLFMNEHSD